MELLSKKKYSEISSLPLLVKEYLAEKYFSDDYSINSNNSKPNRSLLSEILKNENMRYGADDLAIKNAELLNNDDVEVVIAGQQPCLFTGPAYIIYKAATVLHLAEKLRERGQKAVPVFWVATEDSDFLEVNHAQIGTERYVEELSLSAGIVGNAKVPTAFPQMLQSMKISDDIYDFGDYFCFLLTKMFKGTGLVIADPRKFRCLSREIKKEEILNPLLATAKFNDLTGILKSKGIKPQIDKAENITNIYLFDGQKRARLRYDGKTFANDYGDKFSAEYLVEQIDNIIPNAILRPIIQEHIFRSRYFIAGINELNYLLLLPRLFELFNVNIPEFVIRNGFFVLDKQNIDFLNTNNIHIDEILTNFAAAKETIFQHEKTINAYDNYVSEIEDQLRFITCLSKDNEATLERSALSITKKIEKQLNLLRKKNIKHLRDKSGSPIKGLYNINEQLFPKGVLQERCYNIFTYAKSVEEANEMVHNILNIMRENDFDTGELGVIF